ncbi:hypothetical protein RHMOL_Rhmol08G0174600 [Rhododendron molle]|uniref:Uncharacterized protein n=1 Tax=Rhododendron molle TaxID=49168 RepID=A0ACC0MQM8_RHOML|nr:hypothetical protein RHMOL_Rhmol08G0174600 [Rhododendron molle]
MNVFRFGDDELCPTIEEFQAYLRGFAFPVLVVPPLQERMASLLLTTLDIPSHELTTALVHDDKLNIVRLIKLYIADGD